MKSLTLAYWIGVVQLVSLTSGIEHRASAQSLRASMAVVGDPFGVFVIEVPIPPGLALDQVRVLVDETQDRVFYPATTVRTIEVSEPSPLPPLPGRLRPGGLVDRVRSALRKDNKRKVPVAITVTGLFRGDEQLDLQLLGDIHQKVTITPISGPAGPGGATHAMLLEQWWNAYSDDIDLAEQDGDHPMLMHKYLAYMLSHRLNLPWPPPSIVKERAKRPSSEKLVEPLGTLALLSAIEPLRDEILEQALSRPNRDAIANVPLPSPPQWRPTILPVSPTDVAIEPIAARVPPECFYLRFGSFANYVWFQDLSARNGGDLAQIVLVRGFNYETSARMERMLNTRMTAVSKMFGDKIIHDMAIVGRDMYMKEGASLGVIFSASNRSLLMTSFDAERKQAVARIPGATLQKLTIEGKEVSLLSTPDNSIRSFLVADGDFVMLTTSRHLAQRFLQISAGQPSLASLESFRWARVWMPEQNNYSVFAYFSPEFFHELVSPQFQIELYRRLESIAHLEIAEVAARAAMAEGVEVQVPALSAAGLLPDWFDARPDGSQILRSADKWIDSARGARGSFLPIVDVEVNQVSQAEAERYGRLADFYQKSWQQMDPMLVGLRRFQGQSKKVDGGNVEGDKVEERSNSEERVAIEAYIAPFAREKYGWIGDLLAPSAPLAIAMPGDDLVSVQLLMNGTAPLTAPRQPYHLFAGVKDMVPPAPGDTKGLIKTFRALKAVPGYLGAYPGPGYLDQLPLGLGGGRPDAAGFSRSIIGLWRWQGAGFSLISFDRSILEHTLSFLAPIRVDDSAQVRLRINSLQGSRLSGWVNDQWYQRAWRASHGNAELLDAIGQQLKVRGPEALGVAESMLDVRLNCPLGGKFTFTAQPTNAKEGWWTSDAWRGHTRRSDGTVGPPPDYVAPWLKWFRGANLHLTQFPERLAVVGTFDIQPQPADPRGADSKTELPSLNFDLFQLPFKMFGGGEANNPAQPQKRKF